MTYPAGSFLAGLEPADRDVLFGAGAVKGHRQGHVLLLEGGRPTSVLFILEGRVKLTKVATSGREVVLELRGPGDVVGELGAIDGGERSASVVAIDDVEVLTIPAERFNAILRERAGLTHRLLVTVVARVREAAGRQLELGTADVMGRICRRLLELAASSGTPAEGGVLVRSAISQQELADWSGASRDGVVRALHELRDLGWVETGRNRLLLRDLDALRDRAGG